MLDEDETGLVEQLLRRSAGEDDPAYLEDEGEDDAAMGFMQGRVHSGGERWAEPGAAMGGDPGPHRRRVGSKTLEDFLYEPEGGSGRQASIFEENRARAHSGRGLSALITTAFQGRDEETGMGVEDEPESRPLLSRSKSSARIRVRFGLEKLWLLNGFFLVISRVLVSTRKSYYAPTSKAEAFLLRSSPVAIWSTYIARLRLDLEGTLTFPRPKAWAPCTCLGNARSCGFALGSSESLIGRLIIGYRGGKCIHDHLSSYPAIVRVTIVGKLSVISHNGSARILACQ